jgi:hypothetical protein
MLELNEMLEEALPKSGVPSRGGMMLTLGGGIDIVSLWKGCNV